MRTIRSQTSLVSALLILALSVQVIYSRYSHTKMVESQTIVESASRYLERVQQLESNVINLQRQVLIFTETASKISLVRFEQITQNLWAEIVLLYKFQQIADSERIKNIISRMEGHLKNYESNFKLVKNGRNQRQHLYTAEIPYHIERIKVRIENNFTGQIQSELLLTLSQVENTFYRSIISPSYSNMEAFRELFQDLSASLTALASSEELANFNIDILEELFNSLAQTTRGYVYLVNVVMTGIASEFLFLTKDLKDIAIEERETLFSDTRKLSEDTRVVGDIVAGICMLLATLMSVFLFVRVLRPIKLFTRIFGELAAGNSTVSIPSPNRRDEIGLLARSAKSFLQKNKQTEVLLEEAQEYNAKQAELTASLSEEKARAEQATKSKSMFLANMSHEIRTPMNGVMGLVELTLKTELDKKQRDYLNKVAYSSKMLMGVINDILDFSKIEAGKIELEKTEFSISDVYSNVASVLYLQAKEKNLNLILKFAPSIHDALIGDPLRINQVILNLCTNAIKFTHEGYIEVWSCIESRESNDYLVIKVKDTGIGMTPQQSSSVFESFSQADNSTSRKYGGTGLGLSIAKQLAELMGGSISVKSEVDKGSTFTVSFQVELVKSADQDKQHYKNLYFYQLSPISLVDEQLKNELSSNKHPSLDDFLASSEPPPSRLLLLETSSAEDIAPYKSRLTELVKEGLKLGFVSSMLPISHHGQLERDWQVPVLTQPYSPNNFFNFLEQINGFFENSNDTESTEAQDTGQFSGHILIVEDFEINRVVAAAMLEELGLTYDIAENGEEAITKINENPNFDLVLMDVQMPVLDGLSATKKLRELGYTDLIICGLSANAMSDDRERGAVAGMNDYLTKPLESDALREVCQRYLTKPKKLTAGEQEQSKT